LILILPVVQNAFRVSKGSSPKGATLIFPLVIFIGAFFGFLRGNMAAGLDVDLAAEFGGDIAAGFGVDRAAGVGADRAAEVGDVRRIFVGDYFHGIRSVSRGMIHSLFHD